MIEHIAFKIQYLFGFFSDWISDSENIFTMILAYVIFALFTHFLSKD